jgi:hypothetical protein
VKAVRLFSWFMCGANVGAALVSVIQGDVMFTLFHAVIAGVLYYQLCTQKFLKG